MSAVVDTIWVAGADGQRRLLFWQDGVVAEIWHEAVAGRIGTIHNARINRVFADQGRATGQLDDGTAISVRVGMRDRLRAGDVVRITIVGAPRDGKAWQATIGARLVSPYFVFLPDKTGLFTSKAISAEPSAAIMTALGTQLTSLGGGAIMRRMALGVDLPDLQADLATLAALWAAPACDGDRQFTPDAACGLVHDAGGLLALAVRHTPNSIVHDAPGDDDFAAAYDQAVAAATEVAVGLPSGGVVWIERTHALTAIDLDSGTGSLAALMQEAPAVIARHLRLRSLTGLIAIDVPRASLAVARRFTADLEQAFLRDPRMPEILGRSRGGLLECRIAHGQPPLADSLQSDHDRTP